MGEASEQVGPLDLPRGGGGGRDSPGQRRPEIEVPDLPAPAQEASLGRPHPAPEPLARRLQERFGAGPTLEERQGLLRGGQQPPRRAPTQVVGEKAVGQQRGTDQAAGRLDVDPHRMVGDGDGQPTTRMGEVEVDAEVVEQAGLATRGGAEGEALRRGTNGATEDEAEGGAAPQPPSAGLRRPKPGRPITLRAVAHGGVDDRTVHRRQPHPHGTSHDTSHDAAA